MSKFLNIVNLILNEQGEDPEMTSDQEITPKELDSEEKSALPEPEEVALDAIKYKTLLTALKEALYIAYSGNLDAQKQLSNIVIDTEDLNSLKSIESTLMSLLNQTESVPRSNF